MLKKIILTVREKGLGYLTVTGWHMSRSFFRSAFLYPLRRKEYTRRLRDIQLGDRIFLWTQDFGWNVPLFQRPQHIARCLAEKNCTVFYYTNPMKDPKVDDIVQICPNLYLINKQNRVLTRVLENRLSETTKPRYLHLYSTNYRITLDEVKAYQRRGYQIFYEYIDDLAPEISGTGEIPGNIRDIFQYVTGDDRIPMAVTADLLRDQVIALRGPGNLAFSTNGVDVAHFRKIPEGTVFTEAFQAVLEKKQPIVGYYGAVAKWFDYELLKYAARKLPNVSFVLLGKIYDESYFRSDLRQIPNIHFVGSVPYGDLPAYAARFAVCTIPFCVNSITNATSPLKLFEYMAIGKPILTTAMHESSKYRSVHISCDPEDFVSKIKMLLKYNPRANPEYYATLKQEAEKNTWEKKAEIILEMLRKQEVMEHSQNMRCMTSFGSAKG